MPDATFSRYGAIAALIAALPPSLNRSLSGRSGCGSNKTYGGCHLPADMLADPAAAEAEFRRLFGGAYDDRKPPKHALDAAHSRWRVMPPMSTVFAHRMDPSGGYMI